MTACSIIPSEITFTTQAKGIVVDGCPAIVEYTPEQNKQVASELDRLGVGSLTERYLKDYRDLRNQVRACRATASGVPTS